MAIRYLSAKQLLLIHSIAVDETSGLHGVRDYDAILSLAALPRQKVFGKELYPTAFEKAAVYARNIIMNHPFVDGNKRTGMTAAGVFLENNGYQVMAKEGEIEKFALKIVTKRLETKAVAQWFKQHSKKVRSVS